ncbi:hypothetical protein M378DRAFT_10017 [Amanita muscaria Koide BX008]|uniref:Uncharacterized protein n=1 Tax=Amanita muscaria (strain Koide BX008) TaxID=946122 RepID=A0A0C2STF6_AMAMK|nr:hypothetical protein M378DRAFT_10017 [Amanita muscaria Koide BX008]
MPGVIWLMYLTRELSKTGLENWVIASPNLPDSRDIVVMGFNNEELQQWKSGMQTGVEKNDWVGLIKHPKLRRIRKVPNDVHIPVIIGLGLENAVICAFNLPYYGGSHTLLLRVIDELHALPIERKHTNIVPIVQSSGTGKSKTVDEVAKMRILFPLCIREHIGEICFAYPPTDRVVHDHLLRAVGTKNVGKCKQYFRSFLSALFTLAHLQGQKLFPGGKKVSYESMVMTFRGFFAEPLQRIEFYEAVVRKAQESPDTTRTSVWNSLKELTDGLKDRCVKWLPTTQCPILISIDEVHAVSSTLFVVVLMIGRTPFITLSTNLSGIKETASSMRGRTLPAPVTELPFDVYVINQPLTPSQATLASVGSLGFTAKFGRPLFYSSYLSRKDLPNIVEGIMRNVREKLSGRVWPPTARVDTIDASSIAVLSVRLHLDLSLATAYGKPYEEELVRNHLRLLYSVHENRETFVTGTSPEPLIAEASAQILNHSLMTHRFENDGPYMDLWSLLGKFVDDGLASEGAVVELIGRALSISAMDRAINRLSEVCELKYQTPVAVTDYYKALLTDEAWDVLRQSLPANRARLNHDSATKTFEDAFQDAYFHFSHWAKANDTFPLRDTLAWALWLRGSAVYLQPNQERTDRMVPIYFSTRGKVSPDTMSLNLEQDRMGPADPANIDIQSAEALQIFSHEKLPYIAVVHRYAVTKNQGIFVTPTSYDLRRQTSNDSIDSEESEAPRYQIVLQGLSAYDITGTTRTSIQAMINHVQKSPISLVYQLLDGVQLQGTEQLPALPPQARRGSQHSLTRRIFLVQVLPYDCVK